MAGPPIWPLFGFVLSPTGASARYGAPAPTAGLHAPDRAGRKPAPRKGPADVIEFKPRSRRSNGSPTAPPDANH